MTQQDNPQAAQAAQAPSLYDLLHRINTRLATIESEVTATRLAIVKRRLPPVAAPGSSLAELAKLMQKRLDFHYKDLGTPIQLYHLSRNFSRKLSALGVTAGEVLAQMPDAHGFASGTGGVLVMPKSEWEALPYERQVALLGTTTADLRAQRERDINAVEKLMGGEKKA